jgi:competence protein CoiA
MQYALVNGVRAVPVKGLVGVCIGCGHGMIAKCGDLKMHHWAHVALVRCDSWWEPETLWHRDWKERFPEGWREVTFYDMVNEEYHRADVHTTTGITIEFQNSPLSLLELHSREAFYGKLIWVLNGKKFKGFELGKAIPDPNCIDLNDYDLHGHEHVTCSKKSERFLPSRLKDKFTLIHPELQHLRATSIHYSFSWRYAHKAWFEAAAPVFIDLGGHFLYWLKKRKQYAGDFMYLQLVSRVGFLEKYNNN